MLPHTAADKGELEDGKEASRKDISFPYPLTCHPLGSVRSRQQRSELGTIQLTDKGRVRGLVARSPTANEANLGLVLVRQKHH
jgi:hypothetical protein